MAHNVLIGGTGYAVKGGRVLIGGTGYAVKGGRTLIGGTGYGIGFGTPIGELETGTVVYLDEGGTATEFLIGMHNYESANNGAGRTLLVRRQIYKEMAYSRSYNPFVDSYADKDLNQTYLALFSSAVQAAIGTTTFPYTPGRNNITVTTLSRAVFLLSLTEYGLRDDWVNVEGSAIRVAGSIRSATFSGHDVQQWTRSPMTNDSYCVAGVSNYGSPIELLATASNAYRPVFTLPAETTVDADYHIML